MTVEKQREELFRQQGGVCAHCGRVYLRHQDMALAHKVANTKANIKKYGKDRVGYIRNKALVCRELHGGVDCNAAMNIGNKPATSEILMEAIRSDMQMERFGERIVEV